MRVGGGCGRGWLTSGQGKPIRPVEEVGVARDTGGRREGGVSRWI